MVRYRFFLYAGLLPYLLGAAWAYATTGTLDVPIFWSGLGGVVLVNSGYGRQGGLGGNVLLAFAPE